MAHLPPKVGDQVVLRGVPKGNHSCIVEEVVIIGGIKYARLSPDGYVLYLVAFADMGKTVAGWDTHIGHTVHGNI